MRRKYQVQNGCIIISSGNGRASTLSEKIPLFDENIAGRFSENETYLDMQKASLVLQRKSSRIFWISIVSVVILSIYYVGNAYKSNGGVNDIAEAAVGVLLMAGLFLIPVLVAGIFFVKENISGCRINILVDDDDVRSSLRSYYGEFVTEVISDILNSRNAVKIDIQDFAISAIAEIDSKVGEREVILNGMCRTEDRVYDIKVKTRFNPIYYNLKVVGYEIE